MNDAAVPGVSIAIIKDARLAWQRNFGVRDSTSGIPVDENTVHFDPGERYLYSGEGYFYLQSVITHLTGRRDATVCTRYEADLEVCATDIDRYLTANLLAPFAMASSGYAWDDRMERRAAHPHDVEGKPLVRAQPTPTGAARYAAAGGLHTTATDFAKFLLEIINPRASDAFRLTRRNVQEMLRPQVKVDASTSWALGWQVRHTPRGNVVQHQGGQGGFQAFAAAMGRKPVGLRHPDQRRQRREGLLRPTIV